MSPTSKASRKEGLIHYVARSSPGLSNNTPSHPLQSGVIDFPIDGKQSVSKYKVVSRTTCSGQSPYETLTTVDLWPVTGRMHQLRRHMLHKGTPILGDEKYFLERGSEPNMCLWAVEVDFLHPFTSERVVVSIPEPDYYEEIR